MVSAEHLSKSAANVPTGPKLSLILAMLGLLLAAALLLASILKDSL